MEDNLKGKRRTQCVDKYKDRWEEKSEVYGGIPLHSSYEDGQTVMGQRGRTYDADRYGNHMSKSEKNSLMWYREQQRELWLKEKDND